MSLRRQKYNLGYNRSEEKEEAQYWLGLLSDEVDDYRDYPWCGCAMYCYCHDYFWPGAVNNMEEYHQMKVLTLLRSLNIRSAHEQACERGW